MIKKFLTVLVLGLAVFAVSCSKDEDSKLSTNEKKFVEVLSDKSTTTVTDAATHFSSTKAEFSNDGQTVTFTYTDNGDSKTIDFKFVVGGIDSDNNLDVDAAGYYTATSDSVNYLAVVELNSNKTDIGTVSIFAVIADADINTVTTATADADDGDVLVDVITITAGADVATAVAITEHSTTAGYTVAEVVDEIETVIVAAGIGSVSGTAVTKNAGIVQTIDSYDDNTPDGDGIYVDGVAAALADATFDANLNLLAVDGYLFADYEDTKVIKIKFSTAQAITTDY